METRRGGRLKDWKGGGQGPRRGPRTKNQMLRLKKFHKERELAEIYSLFEHCFELCLRSELRHKILSISLRE